MRPSVSYVCAIAVGGVLSAKPFTTPVAERPDEPVPSGAMPADWREYPFVDAVAEPSLTAREREDGFLVFSRPITEPVYRETRPQDGERVESLHAFAARGERAQLNFAVYPGRDIVGFAAVAETPFAARLEQVTYAPFVYDHYQVRGKYRVGPAYLVPSARTPLRRGEPLRYVLTMRVPKDAAPGRRHGVVRLGDALRQTVRELPFSLDVLPFELKSDPNRFRTAYVNRYYDVAGTVEYGFDIPGTIYVNHDAAADRLFAADLDEIEAKWLAAGGLPPRRYIALLGFVGKLYRHYTGKAYAKNATPMPPDAFFDHIGRLGRTFLDEWKAKGRPELFVIGADEPYPSSAPYVSRLFRTLKDAGFRLFVTSWSARDPKLEAALSPYVDVWCDQYFVSPTELADSGKAEHWCYPNHNAFEIKDAPTQSRGGRMTWGFGAWKMADTTIVPWAWSWNSAPRRKAKIPQLADGLAALKPDGTEWVSWFWEAIFAGAVDGDYIYTLQDAVLRRGGPAEAKALLQELYDSVPAEPKYLAANHWGDAMFDSARARVAAMIVEAARLAETNAAAECPSVLPGLKWHPGKAEALDFLAREERAGRLVRRPVPPAAFYPSEDECRVRAEADGSVHCTISVDLERAGNPAGYKCGSPSLMARLASGKDGQLDVTPYAFLSYEMRVRSNRCADDAAKWPHAILFTSRTADGGTVTKGLSGVPCNLAADQWHSIMIPLSGLGLSDEEKAHVISMRWYFLERDYSHGDVLEFDVRNASLIGVGKPLLISLAPFVSWAGAMEVRWRTQIVGDIPASGVPARVRLRDAAGGIVAESVCDLRHADAKGALRLASPLAQGRYDVEVSLADRDGVAYQSSSAPLVCSPAAGEGLKNLPFTKPKEEQGGEK